MRRGDFFFKIGKCDFRFIREIKVYKAVEISNFYHFFFLFLKFKLRTYTNLWRFKLSVGHSNECNHQLIRVHKTIRGGRISLKSPDYLVSSLTCASLLSQSCRIVISLAAWSETRPNGHNLQLLTSVQVSSLFLLYKMIITSCFNLN